MTTFTHSSGALSAPLAKGHSVSTLLTQFVAALEQRAARRRQLIALDRLDDRLRADIGLPPRLDHDVTRIRALGIGAF